MIVLNNLCYMKESELIEIVRKRVKNPQDRFLLMAIYYGVNTVKIDDITKIKVSDVDFENNVIHYAGTTMKMNEEFRRITKEAIEQTSYERIFIAGTKNDTYKLNMDSEYVIKTKPMSISDDGLHYLKYSGFRSRFISLKKKMNLEEITIYSLATSRIAEDMLNIKKDWKSLEVKDYLEKHNINRSNYRIYKLLQQLQNVAKW